MEKREDELLYRVERMEKKLSLRARSIKPSISFVAGEAAIKEGLERLSQI